MEDQEDQAEQDELIARDSSKHRCRICCDEARYAAGLSVGSQSHELIARDIFILGKYTTFFFFFFLFQKGISRESLWTYVLVQLQSAV